ncbi:peptidoglycan recognition protein family protein [Streptomyces sp. WMMC897]|uniref:peptidoglycan recognition protein family protein n=1 Tax=Streptomyces sp. WMMC897 TaxID=3014782 RepID=UPI0022B6BB61|nr:N-acetylmuramoyl-L-alanine amidase [Streptomyces sp. WMMC897]MCZ7414603.1 N-acetylmuramoyl-L-alanine amidase [Streptomyces sp. WMMC897]
MRALLTSSIGVVCSAALLVPLASSSVATPAASSAPVPVPGSAVPPAEGTASGHPESGAGSDSGSGAEADAGAEAGAARPAGNRSLPLEPATPNDPVTIELGAGAVDALAGIAPREVESFSLLGVAWADAREELHSRVQVRTRDAQTGEWSEWRDLAHHTDEAPDPGSAEGRGGPVRGSTAPLWVGTSDGVAVRVLPEAGREAAELPEGLRLEMVDPGGRLSADPAAGPDTGSGADLPSTRALTSARSAGAAGPDAASPEAPSAGAGAMPGAGPEGTARDLSPAASAASAANARIAELGAKLIPALNRKQTAAGLAEAHAGVSHDHVGPRPGIVTRRGWGADESLRDGGFLYTNTVKAAFVHHTGGSNSYSCSQAPSVIRSIYRYHTISLGWRDIGYNFLIDKCGQIYEGRAGGVRRAVMGAHTYGFNHDTMGIAVLGSFGGVSPTKQATDAVAKLTAWKLGLFGINPAGSVTLTSGGGKYPRGTRVRMEAVSGHRDGYATACPGARLYSALGGIRSLAARLQGR